MAFLSNLSNKLKEYVKLWQWLQYVALQVGLIPGLQPKFAASAATISAAVFFLKNVKSLGPNDPKFRTRLAAAGYPVMVGASLLHHPTYAFIGGALVMTEFVYELIYP